MIAGQGDLSVRKQWDFCSIVPYLDFWPSSQSIYIIPLYHFSDQNTAAIIREVFPEDFDLPAK